MIIAALAGTVLFTCKSCVQIGKLENIAENLPQVTSKEELETALSGPKAPFRTPSAF